MKTRRLGNSELFVNPIGMGCWAYGGGAYWGEQSQVEVNRLVHHALDVGINFFDTAEMYNNGESEISLGEALGEKRHKAVICSKVGPNNAYAGILEKHCDASLKRLNTDYIDVYMLHWPLNSLSVKHFTEDQKKITDPPTVEEAFSSLMKLQAKGKIRYIGLSNFGTEQMQEALDTGAQIIANEMPYNILSRAIEAEILPFCLNKDISIVGSMALQQGLLAGIYSKPEEVPPHQAHSRHFSHESGRGTARHGEKGAEFEMFQTISQLKEIAEEMQVHIAQLSIAWVLSKRGIASTLVGSRTKSELESNLEAADLILSDDVIKRIDRISQIVLEKLGSNPDYYESQQNSRIR